ncbi:arsenic metallochaperone ArsD family protein [Pseudomonas aeruginosa]|uniref:arsenite efflux transporter metallochaperone ArsD n=1 Tax=Pseudomonas TaxID=286 RepID=UPI0028B0A322|nr:arsenic metallochaperone ArsD family protein [Pseudomonas lopnurensis]
MTTIEIFEPAGCCATSSVVIDQNALHFNADMDWCKQQGFEVKRHNLLNNPQSFISNPRVKEFLDVSGTQSLPVTLVNDVVALTGRLPNREELARWFGAEVTPTSTAPTPCCTPTARA